MKTEPSFEAQRIDAEVCKESVCNNCGHKGMKYKWEYSSCPYCYRAFMVCPKCKHEEEF